jgi:hypothetical protein
MKRIKNRTSSRNRGSVAALAFIGCVPLIAAIGGVSVDSMHFNDARGALQRATDAAALTGIEYMSSFTGTKKWDSPASSQDPQWEDNINYALAVASMNGVDGDGVYTHNGGLQRSVSVELKADSTLPGYDTTGKTPNKCVANGTVHVRSLFAHFFGNFGQTVQTHSVAGMIVSNVFSKYAPILVSWTDQRPVLKDTPYGTWFTIDIKDIPDATANGRWIMNNQAKLGAYIRMIAGQPGKGDSKYDGTYPVYHVGSGLDGTPGVDTSNAKGPGKDLELLEGMDLPVLVSYGNDDVFPKGNPKDLPIIRVVGMKNIHITPKSGNQGFLIQGYIYPLNGGVFDPNFKPNPSPAGPYITRLIE